MRVNIRVRFAAFIFLAISSGFILSGCAPALRVPAGTVEEAAVEAEKEREIAFSVYVKRQDRLLDVAWPLMASASALCKDDRVSIYGFIVHDKKSYDKEYSEVAKRYFALDGGVRVRYANPNLPAGKAGLVKGDSIRSIDGVSNGGMDAKTVHGMMKKHDASKPLSISVERDGNILNFNIESIEACSYGVRLVAHDAVNAFADGRNVTVTSGMMRFAETDGEIALVVAHEIAHNALGHITKRIGTATLGTIFDILIYSTTGVDTQGLFTQLGARVFSQQFEMEADYAGLYIAARADYDIKDAPLFWRKMAAEYPSSIKESFMSTHPSSPKRFVALENTVGEIARKKRQGLPLLPEEKKQADEKKQEPPE